MIYLSFLCIIIILFIATEAINIANQLCHYGYFFPVNDSKNLVVKDDSSLYRFQVGVMSFRAVCPLTNIRTYSIIFLFFVRRFRITGLHTKLKIRIMSITLFSLLKEISEINRDTDWKTSKW